jgi:hypothetical protein
MKEKNKIFCVPADILNLLNVNNFVFINPEMKESFIKNCKQNGSFIIRKDITSSNFAIIPFVLMYSDKRILIYSSSIGFEIDLLENNWNGNFINYINDSIGKFIDNTLTIRGKFKFEDIGFFKVEKVVYYIVGIRVDNDQEFVRCIDSQTSYKIVNGEEMEPLSGISDILIKNEILEHLGLKIPKLRGQTRTIAMFDEFANFPEDGKLEKFIPVKEKTEERLGKRKRKVKTKVSKSVRNKED